MGKDPGKTPQTARVFRVGQTGKTIKDSLSPQDTIDLWRVDLKARSSLNVTLKGLRKGSNADVAVLSSSGQVIDSSKKRGNKTEQFTTDPLNIGTVYVRVKLQRGSSATSYALKLSADPTADQFGDSFATSTPLRVRTATDFVGNSDPNDFFGFGLLVAGQLKLDLTGLTDDANLALYDSRQNLLFSSDNPGTASETINQNLTDIAGTTYYVRVSQAPGKDTPYTFNYSFEPNPLTTTASGLRYIDLAPGTGETPKTGQRVTVQYTGILTDGTKFDSSRDRNQPFFFNIGKGQVIQGWEEGLSTMRVGGRRQLIIPPALGYGSSGAGSLIPPNATLIFDVEIVSITDA